MPNSKILFSAPVNAMSLQNAARALHDSGLLGAYCTNFGVAEGSYVMRGAERLDRMFSWHIARELRRRVISEVPMDLIRLHPWCDIFRTALARANISDKLVDLVEARCLKDLDRHVAKQVAGFSGVYAYNRSCLETFRAAKRSGAFCILAVRDLEPRFYETWRDQEYAKYPLLKTAEQKTLDDIEEALSATSKAEWELADLVIMNSDLCRESYSAYGDLAKVRVVPLAFPVVDNATDEPRAEALRILWAGTFSIRKGAHYLVDALNAIPPEIAIEVHVFGKQELPNEMFHRNKRPIMFKPTIPRSQLLKEYRRADVLVLPTLADTFAMVITEAMSQGLPVIATPRAGASLFIRSGENGIVVPACDAKALAEALCWCAGSRVQLHKMRNEARETARLWQWPDFRRALSQAIGDAVGQRR